MKLAQAQTQYAQFIDLSPDPKKPDAIELKIEALRKQKEVERMRQTSIEMMNKERHSAGTQDARSWNLLIGKRNNAKYTYDFDGKPLKITNPVITPSSLAPQAVVLSQNIVIAKIANDQIKSTPNTLKPGDPNNHRAMTSIPKKSTPLEPLEKKVLPSLKSSSATSLDLISPQPVLAPFESLEKQVLRDLKPAKGVSLKVASGSIKESNILDIIEENPEIAQERMSKEQYMKLRAEQESSIYNTLRANYAKMSRQQTKYAQIAQSTLQTSTQSNLINIVETSIKQPISEIDIEKNIDDNFAFDSNTPISQTKKKTPTSNIFTIEPKNFKKKPISSAEIAPIGVKEKPEKSRTDTETSITFCNDPKLINYFFEADKKVSHNNMISPRDPGLAPLSDTKNRARDMVEERPREEEFSRFYNKENDQKTSFIGDVPDARRPGSVVRFAEQTFNDPYLITPEKNKIKLPKAMSFGTRTRDRFKIQAPRLKKMHDYFS